MNNTSLFLLLLLVMSSSSSAANFYIAPEFGFGNLTETYNVDTNDYDPIYSGLTAGYLFDSNVLVETQLGVSFVPRGFWIDFFDVLNEYKLAIGYDIPVRYGFSIIPKVGISHWRYTDRIGDNDFNVSGNDVFAELTAQYKISDFMQVYGSYAYNDYDLIDSNTSKVGFKFSFGQ